MDWMNVVYGVVGGVAGIGIGYAIRYLTHRKQAQPVSSGTLGEAVTALAAGDYDRAIDTLVQVLARDTGEVDAYLTLGILYRRKGWYFRAIDIHRRLLSRTMIGEERKRQAFVALAQDFESAGLVDRALNIMRKVLRMKQRRPADYELLARLYESVGEWEKAAETWLGIGAGGKSNAAYCLAMKAIRLKEKKDYKAALRVVHQSLKIDKENPAALLTYAEILALQGKLKNAVKQYERLQSIRIDLTGVIADSIEAILRLEGHEALQAFYLKLMKEQAHKPRVAVRFAQWLAGIGEREQAARILSAVDSENLAPEMKVRLMETAEKVGLTDLADRIAKSTLKQVVNTDRFICYVCGDAFPSLVWRCQKCRKWGTIQSKSAYEYRIEGERFEEEEERGA